ncbi:ArsR family transcriptional regulator [Halobacillus fulvus]|nr:ArsR family transcriptional regulator [Halobacillus fulvus]
MELYRIEGRQRKTYEVDVQCGLLWEAALGIAAITNEKLVDTLEESDHVWGGKRSTFSESLENQLRYVQKHNTWKAILQLLHHSNCVAIKEWRKYVHSLRGEELKRIALPYLGGEYEEVRKKASEGDRESVHFLMEAAQWNPFYPDYIQHIVHSDEKELKSHLIEVMEEWWRYVLEPNQKEYREILERDAESKREKRERLDAESFVEWATNGITYLPEPGVFKVLLIPHYVYRPWNVEADLEGTKVMYYPVSNESINPKKQSAPDEMLVRRLKALGDETRLTILKKLTINPYTLKQLTEELKMGKTTVHHHVKLLKSSRLVRQEGNIYELNKQVVERLPGEVSIWLEIDQEGDAHGSI